MSKTDILFKVMSQGRSPGKVRLREIMTSPMLAVGPHNTVQETLSIMDKHVIRPYCESPFDTKEVMSSHIDRLHSGVLEGDVRRMFE